MIGRDIPTPFEVIYREIRDELKANARAVDTGQWQSQSDTALSRTYELPFVSFAIPVPTTRSEWVKDTHPNMPWAEDHFQERIGGQPLNPPPSAAYWPYRVQGHDKHIDEEGRFSHTYPERLWSGDYVTHIHDGRTSSMATITDLIELLDRERHTRQAFIPIWWPIDGCLASYERVPCTIGYHFMIRSGQLHCHYFMRSCDLLRHFRDDVYMAGRLMQWLSTQLKIHTQPGTLHMVISSMHIFEGDVPLIQAGLQ